MKKALFNGHSFFCIKDRQYYFKFYVVKGKLPVYRVVQRTLGFS